MRFPPAPAAAALFFFSLGLPFVAGCHRGPADAGTPESRRALEQQERQLNAEVRQQLESIPTPVKSKYMAVKTLEAWENPFVTVQDDLLTLHVTVADGNTSDLGQGGMLRPLGARRQALSIRPGELSAALNAVPSTAWPYGRVLAVEEAHNVPERARPEMRRTVEAVMRTLGSLGVVAYEWNEGGPGLR